MNNNRTGRRYDREFKNSAVALVRSGRTVTEVARDLGVSKWPLGRWVEQARAGQTLTESKILAAETPEQRELRRLRQEFGYVTRQRDILKSLRHLVSGGASERFTLMEKLSPHYPTDELAVALEISGSGFAAHRRKTKRPRQRDAQLRPLIRQSFEQSRRTYGSPRVQRGLGETGQRCGKNRIARLMREERLRPKQKRRFRPATANSRHAPPYCGELAHLTITTFQRAAQKNGSWRVTSITATAVANTPPHPSSNVCVPSASPRA